MKKFILTFALFWVSVIWAEEGIPSHVELVTGAKQDAQFLGVKDDTVSLGGTIQGQFTVIRIHKNRFKSIVDDNGNDLLQQLTLEYNKSRQAKITSEILDLEGGALE